VTDPTSSDPGGVSPGAELPSGGGPLVYVEDLEHPVLRLDDHHHLARRGLEEAEGLDGRIGRPYLDPALDGPEMEASAQGGQDIGFVVHKQDNIFAVLLSGHG